MPRLTSKELALLTEEQKQAEYNEDFREWQNENKVLGHVPTEEEIERIKDVLEMRYYPQRYLEKLEQANK